MNEPSVSPGRTAFEVPPAICIVGRKNSGKTTLTVALAAELGRRGLRVATIKHGHHDFEADQPGRDSWRHFHEGGAQASLMCGTGKVSLTLRIDGEPDPKSLIRQFYAGRGYHLVLVEGFKHGTLPKIEVFRRAVHARPLFGPADAAPLLLVTDDLAADSPAHERLRLEPDDAHVPAVATFVTGWMAAHAR